MYRFGTLPATVERVDIATGKRTPWKAWPWLILPESMASLRSL